jgi:hypothetical protein
VSENSPGPVQLPQLPSPPSDALPTTQEMHSVWTTLEWVPGGHSVHDVWAPAEMVPSAQAEQSLQLNTLLFWSLHMLSTGKFVL